MQVLKGHTQRLKESVHFEFDKHRHKSDWKEKEGHTRHVAGLHMCSTLSQGTLISDKMLSYTRLHTRVARQASDQHAPVRAR